MRYDTIVYDTLGGLHRYHHKIGHLKTSDGESSGALYGVLREVIGLIGNHQPTHFVLALEGGGAAARRQVHDGYKMGRSSASHDAISTQANNLLIFAKMMGIDAIRAEGHEADDIIATLGVRATDQARVLMVSDDHDLIGAVGEHSDLFQPRAKYTHTRDAFWMEHGLEPRIYWDVQCITGCDGDGIPGVRGVGDITAYKWLKQHGGDLEVAIEQVPKLKEKADQILRNRLLVTHEIENASWQIHPIRHDAQPALLKRMLEVWEFRSIAKTLARWGWIGEEDMTIRKHTVSEGQVEEVSTDQVKKAAAEVESIKEEGDDDKSDDESKREARRSGS